MVHMNRRVHKSALDRWQEDWRMFMKRQEQRRVLGSLVLAMVHMNRRVHKSALDRWQAVVEAEQIKHRFGDWLPRDQVTPFVSAEASRRSSQASIPADAPSEAVSARVSMTGGARTSQLRASQPRSSRLPPPPMPPAPAGQ